MHSKKHTEANLYVLIAAVIGVVIVVEWITVFFFGHVPAGYP